MINIGIVGCGAVSNRYVDIFLNEQIEGAKLYAVCDIDKKIATHISNITESKAYFDLDSFFKDTNIDLVFILTASGLHYDHVKFSLESGFHTICEKPISLRLDHAEELDKIAVRKDLMAGVVFQNRYNSAIRFLEKEVSNGTFGKRVLSTVKLRWCRYQEYYQDNWHGTWKMDGGVIAQQAIHHLDILQWLGGKVRSVSATFTQRMNKLEADDTTVAIVEFEDGSLGSIEATTAARPIDYEASFSIIAENGIAEIGGIALNKILQWNLINHKMNFNEVDKKYSREVKNGFGIGNGPFIQDVINRLNNGNISAPISIREGMKSLRLAHAIYKSAETRTWINIQDKNQSKLFGIGNNN